MVLNTDAKQLIRYLMRGGTYGHLWTKQSNYTTWFPISTQGGDDVLDTYSPLLDEDCYFGVHPCREIPKTNAEGVPQSPSRVRSQAPYIEALNCLYADFDAKDFGDSKQAAREHVDGLESQPSAVVDSGGGYHCYWFFKDPLVIGSEKVRANCKELQERWVSFVGGDKAVHDLARVLRVPGTINNKEQYKDNPPVVSIERLYLTRTYTPAELYDALPLIRGKKAEEPQQVFPVPVEPNDLSDQELIDRIGSSKEGSKFRKLWHNDNSGFDNDASAGDQSFCGILAFWTGGDGKRIDKFFRASGRMRPKWERDDYRTGTVLKALAKVTEYYCPPDGLLTAGTHDEGNAQCVIRLFPDKYLNVLGSGWCRYTGTHWEVRGAEAALNRDITSMLKQRQAAAWARISKVGIDTVSPLVKAISKKIAPNTSLVNSCRAALESYLYEDIQNFNLPVDELNCRNGTLNLESGELAQHNPNQRYTYCVPVVYQPDADQSTWVKWLLSATGNRPEVVDYLKEAVGYSITGRTREEVAFYIHGPKRSGKGLLIETILAMLGKGTLGAEVDMSRFLTKRSSSSSDDFFLASLAGARFIAASETSGKKWFDPSKLKRWTGGNLIRASHKYQSYFDYRPQFKFWFTSNSRPRVDPDDDAAWDRIRVICFPNSHDESNINKKLKAQMKSKKVLEGILAWAVEGAMRWYCRDKKGLIAPEIIKKETQVSRDEVDDVFRWANEQLIITGANSDRVPTTKAYDEYCLWCEGQENLTPRPRKYWKRSLLDRGIVTEIKVAQVGNKTQQCLIGVQAGPFFLNFESVGRGK